MGIALALFPDASLDGSLLIEQEIRDDLSQTLVLISQGAHFLVVASVHSIVLVAPAIERRFRDSQLSAHLDGGRPGFDLPKGPNDLVLRKPARSHRGRSECWGSRLTLAHIIIVLYRTKG
jgi:hypothetical protein